MTTKTQEAGTLQPEFRAFIDRSITHSSATNRRWALLARRHQLNPELRTAMDSFQTWATECWCEAAEDRPGYLKHRAPLNRYSPGWAWYRMGGAWAFLKEYDQPVDDIPRFIATAQFISNVSVMAIEARILRGHLTRMVRYPHRRPALRCVRSCGLRHAAWWLAQREQGTAQPLTWNALEQREVPTREQARLLDIAAAEWHRIRGWLH